MPTLLKTPETMKHYKIKYLLNSGGILFLLTFLFLNHIE